MELFIILLTVFIGSTLTFFSGFGLGTILLPVMCLFFSIDVAIAATAVVHFFNSFFKFILIFRHINIKLLLSFGGLAIPFSFLGAWVLSNAKTTDVFIHYSLPFYKMDVSLINFSLGWIMIVFAYIELFWKKKEIKISKIGLYLGGAMSGFFGGFSGHQGALRAMILSKTNISKEEFVATSSTIGLLIDLTRIGVYSFSFSFTENKPFQITLLLSIIIAFIGSYLGSKLLKKTTFKFVQFIVSILLFTFGVLLVLGFI